MSSEVDGKGERPPLPNAPGGDVELSEEAVKAYLDTAITSWRRTRDQTALDPALVSDYVMAVHYIDAFQSMRTSLFAETLSTSSEVDGEWTEGLDYGWPQAMVFVIDAQLQDQEALDLARRHVGSAADTLSRIEGVRLSDMGVGLAINETRDRVLAEFNKSTIPDTVDLDLRVTDEAVKALIDGASDEDRYMLRLPVDQTFQYHHEGVLMIGRSGDGFAEVTSEVHRRMTMIRQSVLSRAPTFQYCGPHCDGPGCDDSRHSSTQPDAPENSSEPSA